MASYLRIPVEELQAANLSIRSDFKSFVGTAKAKRTNPAAAAVAWAAKDSQLREVIQKYQSATPELRKKFVRAAMEIL